MKLLLLVIIIASFIQVANAQDYSPRTRKNVEEIGKTLNNFNRKPQWQQKYEIYITGGNYLMNNNDYANAIKSFNKALAIVPNSQEALIGKNYCRQMLKEKSKGRRR
jgi:tetratricopeptide (TPR) repeat protein